MKRRRPRRDLARIIQRFELFAGYFDFRGQTDALRRRRR